MKGPILTDCVLVVMTPNMEAAYCGVAQGSWRQLTCNLEISITKELGLCLLTRIRCTQQGNTGAKQPNEAAEGRNIIYLRRR